MTALTAAMQEHRQGQQLEPTLVLERVPLLLLVAEKPARLAERRERDDGRAPQQVRALSDRHPVARDLPRQQVRVRRLVERDLEPRLGLELSVDG